MRTFKRLKRFFSRAENGRETEREKKCVAIDDSELIRSVSGCSQIGPESLLS